MTWSARLLSLLAPPMQESGDPRVEIDATLEANRRLARYELEREERMARVRQRAERSRTGAPQERPVILYWKEHA
jgi:hypothetical protein